MGPQTSTDGLSVTGHVALISRYQFLLAEELIIMALSADEPHRGRDATPARRRPHQPARRSRPMSLADSPARQRLPVGVQLGGEVGEEVAGRLVGRQAGAAFAGDSDELVAKGWVERRSHSFSSAVPGHSANAA